MKLIVSACLILAGCGAAPSVYDEPLPGRSDSEAMLKIRDGLKPEDIEAWQSVVMRSVNPMAKPSTAKTVAEAIGRAQARTECMAEHDLAKVPDGPTDISASDYEAKNRARIAAYNKEVAAYNACQKLPV